jgi:CBS domain-containing protein
LSFVLAQRRFPLAAARETIKALIEKPESEMTIEAILAGKGHEVATIAPDSTVTEAVAMLGEKRIGALPVTENGSVVGIFSERDVIYCLRDRGADVLQWPVSRVMSAPAITVEPSTATVVALAMMTRRRIRHLPVLDRGELIGIVSIGDLVKHRMVRIEGEAEALRVYIQSA